MGGKFRGQSICYSIGWSRNRACTTVLMLIEGKNDSWLGFWKLCIQRRSGARLMTTEATYVITTAKQRKIIEESSSLFLQIIAVRNDPRKIYGFWLPAFHNSVFPALNSCQFEFFDFSLICKIVVSRYLFLLSFLKMLSWCDPVRNNYEISDVSKAFDFIKAKSRSKLLPSLNSWELFGQRF